jgi:hypothetical protein
VTTRQTERESPERQERERLNALIGAEVIRALGKPDDLRAVMVRRLWGNCYRVNVFTGADVVSGTIAHSYFLTTDGGEAVLTSSPVIVKRYG